MPRGESELLDLSDRSPGLLRYLIIWRGRRFVASLKKTLHNNKTTTSSSSLPTTYPRSSHKMNRSILVWVHSGLFLSFSPEYLKNWPSSKIFQLRKSSLLLPTFHKLSTALAPNTYTHSAHVVYRRDAPSREIWRRGFGERERVVVQSSQSDIIKLARPESPALYVFGRERWSEYFCCVFRLLSHSPVT